MGQETIYALSSGGLPSGVAIIRMSGPRVRFAFETMLGFVPEPRRLVLSDIKGVGESGLLDRGLSIYFNGPNSFTGEDCGEFQIHGGLAVVNSVLDTLGNLRGFGAAEPGEFTRRSFENGKMDLTEVEGLSDLIASQTEKQRIEALKHSGGELHKLYNAWQDRLVRIMALVEAGLDFSDQEDVSVITEGSTLDKVRAIWLELSRHLNDNGHGEIIRSGFKIALTGPANSGKSSLINALAKRDVAIVSPVAGTTRDIIEVNLDVDGYKVIVSDTAGIRLTGDLIEKMGIEKAIDVALDADLVVWLFPSDSNEIGLPDRLKHVDPDKMLVICSKSDIGNIKSSNEYISISVLVEGGLDEFIGEIANRVRCLRNDQFGPMLSRRRHRDILIGTRNLLDSLLSLEDFDEEIVCEVLRSSIVELGRIIGRVDIENVYDIIFSEFCIGK